MPPTQRTRPARDAARTSSSACRMLVLLLAVVCAVGVGAAALRRRAPGRRQPGAAGQPGASRLPRGPGRPARAGGAHHLAAGPGAEDRGAVDLCRAAAGRQLPAPRGRRLRPGHRHLGPGGVQRRRHDQGGGRVPPPLAPVRRPGQPRTRLPAAPGRDLPPDLIGPGRRQRGAVDAAGRDPQPQPDPDRGARPLRLRPLLLAGPHHLGPRRGLRRLPRARPGLRRVPAPAAGAVPRRPRPPGPRPALRELPDRRRAAPARLADR